MKIKEIYKGLYLYTFPNQFELCSTFFRLQEFYESPIKQVKGRYFTYEDAITYYAYNQKEHPEFTYFKDWSGFNVPGNIVANFIQKFLMDMTSKEKELLNRIEIYNRLEKGDFYLIGIIKDDKYALKHEIAHGLYYLNKEYKKDMDKLIKALPKYIKNKIKKNLLSIGYCKQVIKDEIQAYFTSGIDKGMLSILDYSLHWYKIEAFERTFKQYYKQIKND